MQARFSYEAHEQIIAPVDFTFFLNVPLEERRRRMESRGHIEAHDRMTLNQENAEDKERCTLNMVVIPSMDRL